MWDLLLPAQVGGEPRDQMRAADSQGLRRRATSCSAELWLCRLNNWHRVLARAHFELVYMDSEDCLMPSSKEQGAHLCENSFPSLTASH